MSEGGKFPTCSKHNSKRILKICLDLDCQEILLCQQCLQQKKHNNSVDISQFSSLESDQIQSSIERLQNMRKKIIQLNEKVSNQKNNANLIVEECFAQLQKSFLSYLDNCQQNVLNGVSLFSEKFRKIFSKLLQEISDDTYNIKKHVNRLNESISSYSNNQTFDNYTITQGLKSVQYSIIHKLPHLERICEDLQEKQQQNLINTDSIRNNFENIQIDLQQIFSKLSLNAFPAKMDNLSIEYELQPPKMNFNSIYEDTITQIQLEQSIFAHLNPISQIISVSQLLKEDIQQPNNSLQNPASLDNIDPVQLISTGWDGIIKAWNLQKSQPVIEINTYNGGISAAAFKEGQNLLICSHFNSSLEIYQLDFSIEKEENQSISDRQDISKSVLLSDKRNSQENEMSKSVNLSQNVEISASSTSKNKSHKKYLKLGKKEPYEKNIQSIIVKGNQILCGCSTSNILNIPIEKFNYESIDKLTAHTSSVQVLCDFKSLNNQYFLSGSNDSLIYLWDLRKHKPTNMVQNSNEIINSISQLSEYTFLSGSHDSFIKIWDIRMFKNLKTIFGHRDAVSKTESFYSKLYNKNNSSIQKSQLSNIFVSSGNDNIVNIWDVFDQQSLRFSMKGHTDVVWAMDIDIVNKKIYTGSRNEEIKIWSFT